MTMHKKGYKKGHGKGTFSDPSNCSSRYQPAHLAGYTLLELMVAMSILITSLISLPSMFNLIQQNAVISELNHFSRILHAAKYYAIDHQETVTVCPTSDGINCSDNWSQERIVFIDENENEIKDADEILVTRQTADHSISLSWNRGNSITFSANDNQASNGTMIFCPANDDTDMAKAVVISLQGRIRVKSNNLSCGG